MHYFKVLQMDYNEKDILKNFSFIGESTNIFIEDPVRGIIVSSAGQYIQVMSYWKTGTILKTLQLEP